MSMFKWGATYINPADVVLINVGIAQTKIVGIYESAKGDPSEGAAQGAEKYEAVL